MRFFWLVTSTVMWLGACGVNEYRLGGDPARDDAGTADDGGGGSGGDGGGGGGDGGGGGGDGGVCMPQLESCNLQDDDCDLKTDEGFLLDKDPANCGACGNACSEASGTMAGSCISGTCRFTCLPGRIDLDPNVAGCEYTCTPTNAGVEGCDFTDNDCDGKVDEGVDTITSVTNCGGCGRVCTVLHATAECRDVDADGDGDCTFSSCDPGFADLVAAVPGCEYTCPVSPAVAEACNFKDDDCDGKLDEGTLPGAGETCTDPGFEQQADIGRCAFGAKACLAGSLVCQGYVGPLPDAPGNKENACNSVDDDCDAKTDEGYDLQTDVRNCGACGNDCTAPGRVPNAIPSCSAGTCSYVACLPGFVDLDPNQPGCDYACTKSGETDVCDGEDNDCDGDIDDEVTLPTGFCRANGACAGTTPTCGFDVCTGRTRIHCRYGPAVELDLGTCDVASQESRCDNVDNDCDAATDESFPAKHDQLACNDGDIGECRRTGVFACNASQNGVACDFSNSPPDKTPQPEICNGKDEDCDGTLDNGAPDDVVDIRNAANQVLFRIDAYEASRPDATSALIGTMSHRSCSRPFVIPWSSINETQAAQACVAAGKRLCRADEWELACEGLAGFAYPYGNPYEPNTCNGNDYDADCTAPDNDVALPTRTPNGCPTKPAQSTCRSSFGAFDMSGNLKEWTSTEVQPGAFSVRGGGFDTAAGGMTCQFDFVAMDPAFTFSNLGFRCCADAP